MCSEHQAGDLCQAHAVPAQHLARSANSASCCWHKLLSSLLLQQHANDVIKQQLNFQGFVRNVSTLHVDSASGHHVGHMRWLLAGLGNPS